MHVGILTAPLRTKPLAELIPWAAQQGVRALEIDVRSGSQLPALTADDAALEQLQGLLSAHKLQISSLACYTMLTGVSAELAEIPADLREPPKLAEPARHRVGRRLVKQRLQEVRHTRQHRFVFWQRFGVSGRELRNLGVGELRVGPH